MKKKIFGFFFYLFDMKILITESQLDSLLVKTHQTDDIPKLYELLTYVYGTSLDWDDIDRFQSEINDKDIKKEIHDEIKKKYNRYLNYYKSQKDDVEESLSILNYLIKNQAGEYAINIHRQRYEGEKNKLNYMQSEINSDNPKEYDEFYNENYKNIINDYGKEKIGDKIINRISDIERLIDTRIKQMYKELNISKKFYHWGDSPMDDEMGQPFGDKRGVIYLKPSEKTYETDYDTHTFYDGVEVELVLVNKEYRNQGVARELMTRLVNAADKYKVKLYIKIVPQEDKVKVDGLKRFYVSFGFIFDGINGYRLSK